MNTKNPADAARDVFEGAQGQFPPQILAVLAEGGREILRLPQPWGDLDGKIIRHLDGAYGGRQIWLGGTQDWADRVDASEMDRAKIAELEADMAAKLETMSLRHMEWGSLEFESRRRQRLLARSHDDQQRLILKSEDLSLSAFERLAQSIQRAEQVYVAAREAYEEAKGALSDYRQRIQDWHFRGELCKNQRDARAEQEARGVRWGGQW